MRSPGRSQPTVVYEKSVLVSVSLTRLSSLSAPLANTIPLRNGSSIVGAEAGSETAAGLGDV
jgi:hypothetical protein